MSFFSSTPIKPPKLPEKYKNGIDLYPPYAGREQIFKYKIKKTIMLSPKMSAGRTHVLFSHMLQRVIDKFVRGKLQYRFSALIPLKLAFYQEKKDIILRRQLPFELYSELKTLLIPEIIRDYQYNSSAITEQFHCQAHDKIFVAKAIIDGYGLGTYKLVMISLALTIEEMEHVMLSVIKKRFLSDCINLSKDKYFDDTYQSKIWLHNDFSDNPSERFNIRWKSHKRPRGVPNQLEPNTKLSLEAHQILKGRHKSLTEKIIETVFTEINNERLVEGT